MAIIDAGEDRLLQTGDAGQAYYELRIDGARKRIDIGSVELATVGAGTAGVSMGSGISLRIGYRVEFHLPPDRLNQPSPVPAAPEVKESSDEEPKGPISVPAAPASAPVSVPVRDLPLSPPQPGPVSPLPDDYPENTLPRVPVSPAPEESSKPPAEKSRDMLVIPSGNHAIGLDRLEAQFFNQTPRHDATLTEFSIDPQPVLDSLPGGMTFDEAQAHCRNLGLRLPTEQEWEVAAQSPGFVVQAGVFEWTASWYQAYPGNSRSEEEFGETHRVLRGSSDGSTESLFTRRFMKPSQSNSKVAFRCVKDTE